VVAVASSRSDDDPVRVVSSPTSPARFAMSSAKEMNAMT
jgi:hypothetical protein